MLEPQKFYGGEVIEFEFQEIPACLTKEQKQALRDAEKMKKKGQRSLFETNTKKEKEEQMLQEMGINCSEDLLEDLPF